VLRGLMGDLTGFSVIMTVLRLKNVTAELLCWTVREGCG